MALHIIWLLLSLSALAHSKHVKHLGKAVIELEWPKVYHLKAIRSSLTSDLMEAHEIWKTSKLSRIDYNEGESKSVIKTTKDYKYGIHYEINPVTSEDEEIEIMCKMAEGNKLKHKELEDILPSTKSYKADAKEVIEDKYCTKFTFNSKENGQDIRGTIWATYKDASWIPVRYEIIEFNEWLGSKQKHEIWDFLDFSKKFSIVQVFDMSSYECVNSAPEELNGEFMKHLDFINPENNKHVDHVFEAFKKNYNKKYLSANEHAMRKSIFKNSMRMVKENNRRKTGFKLCINQFADKTPAEMNKHKGLLKRPRGIVGAIPFPYDDKYLADIADKLPKEYDTRLLGLVSNVKNQNECGSCWAFGTTAAVEGALAAANGGKLVALANQALVDCAWAFGGNGCNGGYDGAAYDWMMEYGLPTLAEYGPYLNKEGLCRIKNMTKTYPIRGWTDVTALSVNALKVALINHGPLSVSIDGTKKLDLYSSGILYDTTCTQTELNHEMALVGYGEKDGDTFWIIKNSWGPEWGLGGYVHITARDNNCGIATEPTYAVF